MECRKGIRLWGQMGNKWAENAAFGFHVRRARDKVVREKAENDNTV